MHFQEKIFKPHLFSTAFGVLIVIMFLNGFILYNPEDYRFLPITLTVSLVVIILSCIKIRRQTQIDILDNRLSISKIGRYTIFDLSGTVKTINNKLQIPYDRIQEIILSDNKVYLKCIDLTNYVILRPTDITNFISTLKVTLQNLHLTIPIATKQMPSLTNNNLVFENHVLNNIPTIICFVIFLAPLDIAGVYFLINHGEVFFFIINIIVTAGLFYTIFAYKEFIFFSDTDLLKFSMHGSTELKLDKLPYAKILSYKTTKWRVDLKTKTGCVQLVIKDKVNFCKILDQKLQKTKI